MSRRSGRGVGQSPRSLRPWAVADDYPDDWHIPYNLACYCSRLGQFDDAKEWFKKAILLDEKTVQKKGIDDPDLKPMWDSFMTPI
jgi:tetratricopeptide (TPR) repeat protein